VCVCVVCVCECVCVCVSVCAFVGLLYVYVYILMQEYGTYKFYVILLFHGNNGYANAPQCYKKVQK